MPLPTNRSYKKELLDRDDIPFEDIKRNMQELDTINQKLGGHAISLSGLKKLIAISPVADKIFVVEIGCGGGDNLRVIERWAVKHKLKIDLLGIDINPECI